MIYKKIVNNVPSLSSLLLAGMVFGGCKDEKGAADNTDAEVVAETQADNSTVSSKVSIDYTKLSDKQLWSFLKIAGDVFNSVDLGYLKDKPPYLEHSEFVKIKDGSEAAQKLSDYIKGHANWGTKEWKEGFKKLSSKKVAGGGKGGDIQNKAGWVEGLDKLIRPMSVFHEVYVQLIRGGRDVNVTKLEEKVNSLVEEISKEGTFSKGREFFNHGKHIPRSTDSLTSVKAIIEVIQNQSENPKQMWLSKAAPGAAAGVNWNIAIPDDVKVKGKDSLLIPEIAQIVINTNSELAEVQLKQLFFDLFVRVQGDLSFMEMGPVAGNKSNVKLKPEAFAKLYDLAIGAGTDFAAGLVQHINNACTNKYAIQDLEVVRSLMAELKPADYKSRSAKQLMDGINLVRVMARVPHGPPADRAAIIAYGDDATINASNHSFVKKLCNKVARSFSLVADGGAAVDGVNPILQLGGAFDINSQGGGAKFVDAIIDKIIKPELDKLIVKIDVENPAKYETTPITDGLIGLIKELGDKFSKDRTTDKISYKDMEKVSGDGGFDIDVLSKVVKDAGTVFHYIFSSVPSMISGGAVANVKEIESLIIDANAKAKLMSTIKRARYDYEIEDKKEKEAEEYNKKLEAKEAAAPAA